MFCTKFSLFVVLKLVFSWGVSGGGVGLEEGNVLEDKLLEDEKEEKSISSSVVEEITLIPETISRVSIRIPTYV